MPEKAVEIVVSSEELKRTLECIALISGGGGKKQDDAAKQSMAALRIVAVSPYKDGNYMLSFGCTGMAEQLTYRMEGKAYGATAPVDIYVERKRFIALGKTFTGDVRLIFAANELQIFVESSQYNLTTVNAALPELRVPDGGVQLPTSFLLDAMKHCSAVIPKEAAGPWSCIQIKIAPDGSAVCWGARHVAAAKYVVPSTGCNAELNLLLLPLNIQHIAELAEMDPVRLVKTDQGVYVNAPRFDYFCNNIIGAFPDCERMAGKNKAAKSINIAKVKLLAAITRAAVIAGDEATSRIKLCSDTENLYIEVESVAGSGIESVPIDNVDGKDDDAFYMPAAMLSRLIYNLPSDSITLSTNGRISPVFLRAAGSDSFYICAPVRG